MSVLSSVLGNFLARGFLEVRFFLDSWVAQGLVRWLK